ncbi:hypothetical protein E2C01_067232 [Portunus trituberculatus]|uniref:Uncharacterized protein n=1 Tax=Portunus trituberculatus TaxID=210409 RepID=A0A5B7HT19_PORTR|nr:hypothetical protein [Portunus trituberculatus]
MSMLSLYWQARQHSCSRVGDAHLLFCRVFSTTRLTLATAGTHPPLLITLLGRVRVPNLIQAAQIRQAQTSLDPNHEESPSRDLHLTPSRSLTHTYSGRDCSLSRLAGRDAEPVTPATLRRSKF